jgi:hypothetical protein
MAPALACALLPSVTAASFKYAKATTNDVSDAFAPWLRANQNAHPPKDQNIPCAKLT